jgi:pimeloyl-ACP methyl ester carboxylesterase
MIAAVMAMSMSTTSAAMAQTLLAGDWSGALKVGGADIHLMIHVKGAGGGFTATLDSPDQGMTGIPIAAVTQTGDAVVFDVGVAHARYTARLSADGQTLAGEWTQSGASLPLTLAHGVALAAPKRPQTPVKPYPYREVEAALDNRVGHAHLTGTLTLPNGPGPFPAVLLITGSGQQDRDETVFDHHPFLIWADYLTRRGIAVLRIDDRQRGGSTGDVEHATTADFATDVEAEVAYLRTRADIDKRRIGLMGHSEGGMIAPMVAAKDPGIAFIVMLAGPGETGEALLLSQNRAINAAAGAPPAVIDTRVATSRALFDAVKDAPDQATADARLAAAWQALLKRQGAPEATPMPPEVRAAALPWVRYFVSYDPIPTLARVHCPVLAINGSKDLQVPPEENLSGIRAGLRSNPDVTVVELPGLNHLLQTADTGQVSEYGAIEETVSPLALKTVGDWMVAHVR